MRRKRGSEMENAWLLWKLQTRICAALKASFDGRRRSGRRCAMKESLSPAKPSTSRESAETFGCTQSTVVRQIHRELWIGTVLSPRATTHPQGTTKQYCRMSHLSAKAGLSHENWYWWRKLVSLRELHSQQPMATKWCTIFKTAGSWTTWRRFACMLVGLSRDILWELLGDGPK